MSELVSIITPTTGSKYLSKNIESVQNQTYKNIHHLVYIDGSHNLTKVSNIVQDYLKEKQIKKFKNCDFIPLPYSIGNNRWNGHRVYGSSPFLVKEDTVYIAFLDEDNYLDSNHIESMMNVIKSGKDFSYSLRKIVDTDGNFIVNDDCESLGQWNTILGEEDYLIDLNCFLLPKMLLLQLLPIFYRKAREPNEVEIDRALTSVLRQNNLKYDCTYQYTVNYTAGNTQNSVKPEFFIKGNEIMKNLRKDDLPWIKK